VARSAAGDDRFDRPVSGRARRILKPCVVDRLRVRFIGLGDGQQSLLHWGIFRTSSDPFIDS